MKNQSRRHLLQGSLALAGLGLLAGCGVRLPWQQVTKIPRIGYLSLNATAADVLKGLRDGLHELGYVEGQTIVIETRLAASNDQFPALATELVDLPVDLIVTQGAVATQAAMGATRTIPIVFAAAANPVGFGFVASLARPGGNVTGSANLAPQLQGKCLQLLRELKPGLSRVAFLADTVTAEAAGTVREAQEAAQSLGMQLLTPNIDGAGDFPSGFEVAVRDHAEALLVTGEPLIISERGHIIEFAAAARLPLMAEDRSFPTAGGLISYGSARPAMYRRAATYIDKILKGASPAELPVEQATTFDLVINLKTAQALGLTIPQAVLQQATEVIQ